ncbi:MAG: hypothetical protein GY807_16300 [Gammaproteobacteria bacterium]|nr:hypothetical protein [Gammaproteobacteria bacterium]
MATLNRQQLMAKLPNLPRTTGRRLCGAVAGIQRMVDINYPAHFELIRYVGPGSSPYAIREGVDPLRHNAARRHVMNFDGSHESFRGTLNLALRGGESYPYLTGAASIVAGLASAGAGIMFTISTSYLDGTRISQNVQAREGDQIWQVEYLGKNASNILHVEHFILADPFRKNAGNVATEWCIHESIHEVSI